MFSCSLLFNNRLYINAGISAILGFILETTLYRPMHCKQNKTSPSCVEHETAKCIMRYTTKITNSDIMFSIFIRRIFFSVTSSITGIYFAGECYYKRDNIQALLLSGVVSPIIRSVPQSYSSYFIFHRKCVCFE